MRILKQTATHKYIQPHFLLMPYIAHYTISTPSEGEVPELLTLIPDASGCLMMTWDGQRVACHMWGPTTQLVVVKNDVNQVPRRIFVEFLPCGAYHLLGLNMSELINKKISLGDVMPQWVRAIEHYFEQNLSEELLIEQLNHLFLKQLSHITKNESVLGVVKCIHQATGCISTKTLSELTCYSQRHLNRIMTPTLGMSSKYYARLLRINKSVELIKYGNQASATLAQEMGYYDQAHFIHDFKSIVGVTPTQYKTKMSDFYNESYKF